MSECTMQHPSEDLPQRTAGQLLSERGLLKGAVAAKVEERLVDLSSAIAEGMTIEPVPGESEEGLDVLRHSASHLMAQAVCRLFPGTKLNMTPMGTPGGVGTSFEASLHRNIAAALGVSYEEYSRDYSQTNYSSARTSTG